MYWIKTRRDILPQSFADRHTHTQTDRQTDRHSQILAQLKLRKVFNVVRKEIDHIERKTPQNINRG